MYAFNFSIKAYGNLLIPANKDVPEIKQYVSNQFELKSQNWGIHQNSKNGKVYFANSNGLMEYNGVSFIQYKFPENSNIRSVLVDKSGNIFTGSFEDFGMWMEDENCEPKYHSLVKNIRIEKNDEIWRIYELNNLIYFQSFTTIYEYDYRTVKIIKAPFTMLFIFPFNNKFITQIIDNGLYWFDNGEFVFIEGSNLFNQKKVHSIIPYSEKELLIATANDGCFLYNGSNFQYFDSEASDFLKYNTCNTALKLSDSLFVFGSILNGLIFTDIEGNILNTFNKSNGLNNNSVLSLFKDLDNGLWVGLDNGVNYIEIAGPYIHYANTGGTLGTIYAMLKDNDQLYMGTNHGLFLADIKSIAGNFHFSNIRFIPNSQGQVWTLKEFDGQIICGHNEGTFLVNGTSLKKISDITGGWTIKKYNDLLIEGSYTGIVVFQKDSKGSWTFRNKINGFKEPVRYVENDYLGYIWASHHQKGLYKLELNEAMDSIKNIEFFDNISGKESFLNVFGIEKRIVFTNGENIYTYNYVEKIIVPVSTLNKDLGEFRAARQIIHYHKNLYWFILENKIALFEISLDFSARKKFEIFQRSQNLPERDIHLLMLNENILLMPTRESFDSYNLKHQALSIPKNRLNIEKLLFYGKGRTEVRCTGSETIAVPWFTNNITIYFSDPSMFSEQTKSYQYRIPEIDQRWNTTLTNHFSYLNLKHGNYTIEIKSGIAPDEIHNFQFTINTPWYFTIYAIICYFLLGIILFLLGLKIFRFELNRQKELIEMEVTRESLVSELDHKSYELMLTIRYLIHKNEILTELQHEIKDIKEHSSKYPIKNLRNMEKIISEGLDIQTEDWKNAMNNLKLSQQGFFKKLMEHFPDLTPNDMRLCSYLRMNFSTKEIARLLNNSTRAVEISRYRLRKKMNLSHDINLTEFLIGETFSESSRDSN